MAGLGMQLSSSKNPYGSKTPAELHLRIPPLSSSKNPYGSKTALRKPKQVEKLSSSKNPYGSKTVFWYTRAGM